MKKIGTVVLSVGTLALYASKTLVRFGTKGKGEPAPVVYQGLSKADARIVRKLLAEAGNHYLASAPRASHVKRAA